MQTTPQIYRFSGLIAILGLITLLVGLVVMLLLPDIRFAALVIMALGVLLLAIAFILEFRRVSQALTGRRGRFGLGSSVMISTFLGITLLANAISIGNYHRFDVTALAEFTLATQTKEVLSNLKSPIKALVFSVPGDTTGDYVLGLLNEYTYYSDKLSTDFIDPDRQPDQARQYGIKEYGTVVFESQNRRRLVSPREIEGGAEHAFTSAILEVTGVVQKKIYFLTGHDEGDINQNYSQAKEGLLDDLYLVDTLNLMVTPGIPQDCAVLVIAAPQKPLTTSEIEIIDRYLKNGGQALILANPDSPAGIDQIISPWAIKLGEGTIIDSLSYLQPNKNIPVVTIDRSDTSMLITNTYFPGAAAIIPQEPPLANGEMLPVVWTSKESWLERDFDPKKEPTFDEVRDEKGPWALGIRIAAAPTEGTGTKLTRLVVMGDSDFASDEHFYNASNGDLFLNSVSWLAEETELISIRRQVLPFRQLIIDQGKATFIAYSSIGLLPLLVLLVGGIIWWQRK